MDCPKTTMVLSVGWPAVWAFSGATFSAVTPAPTTKTASSKTNLDTVNPYSRSLRMFPPATSAPSLTHARPENHSPPCSPARRKYFGPSSPEQARSAGRFGALFPSLYPPVPLSPAPRCVLHCGHARANYFLRQRLRSRRRLQPKETRPAFFRHPDDRRKVHQSDHPGQGSSV